MGTDTEKAQPKMRLLSLAGLCRRAGGISPGADAAQRSMRETKKPAAVILSSDASARTAKQITDKGRTYGVPVFVSRHTADETGRALGLSSPVAAFAVTGRGPAASLLDAARAECTLAE